MALPLPDLQPVPQLLASVYGAMAFCSAVGALHPTLRKAKNKRVRDAINSWWPPALVGGVALAAGGWIGAAVFSGVSAWTLYEFLRMLPETDRNRRVEALAFVAVPLHYGTLAMSTLPFAAVVLVWTFGVLPLAWLLSAGHRGTLTGLPRVQWGIVMTVVGLSYVARLFHLDPGVGPAGGAGLAALLLLAVMSNDAAQYVFGKLFGRRPLAPGLSPKKTWEGFAGGLATTAVICAFAGPLVAPFDAFEGALVGAALAAAGLVGDLLVSGIKRDAGVKDTGAVLPEHGGVLDRCDSLLFAAPLFFHGLQAWLP